MERIGVEHARDLEEHVTPWFARRAVFDVPDGGFALADAKRHVGYAKPSGFARRLDALTHRLGHGRSIQPEETSMVLRGAQ